MIDIEKKSLHKYTFIDIFAGLGAFRLALESFGAECVFSSEINKAVRKVYAKNFGEVTVGDITKVDETEIPDHDILCAGFPCQAFSISGKQLGFEDSRGTLFFDVARIVRAKRPRVVFLENVRQFASHDGGNTLKVVQNTMEDLGYSFHQKVLNAVDYGIPQSRERIYMICFRKDNISDSDIIFEYPKTFTLAQHVEDFLLNDETLVSDLYVDRADIVMKSPQKEMSFNKTIRIGHVNKGGQGERIYSPKGCAVTFSAHGGGIFAKTGGYLINDRIRKLHPRECARIMGFPDSYQISEQKGQAYTQFGNSIVVDVVQYITSEIAKTLLSLDTCM